MTDRYPFNPVSYRRINLPWICGILILSVLMDLTILFIIINGLPIQASSEPDAHRMWIIGILFILLVNELFLKGGSIYYFFSKKRFLQSGFVETNQKEVLHCEQQTWMTSKQVKRVLSYVPDQTKQSYETTLRFYIERVDKVIINKRGCLFIEGKIKRCQFDEFLEIEMGCDALKVDWLEQHKIPAYYDGMNHIYQQLEFLRRKLD